MLQSAVMLGEGLIPYPTALESCLLRLCKGGVYWSSEMLVQLVKVKMKSLWPVFGLLVTTWAAMAALQHGGLSPTPSMMSWLCIAV